jgi:hypothetical protein
MQNYTKCYYFNCKLRIKTAIQNFTFAALKTLMIIYTVSVTNYRECSAMEGGGGEYPPHIQHIYQQ